MGWYFGLCVECSSKPEAEAIAKHFEKLELSLSDGGKLDCCVNVYQTEEQSSLDWWCNVNPNEIKSTKALSIFVPSTKSEYYRLRDELVSLSSAIEHTVGYHLVKALKIAQRELSLPALANVWLQISSQKLELVDDEPIRDSEEIAQCTSEFLEIVKEVLSQLYLSSKIVSRFVDSEKLIKEPMYEETHPLARSLEHCPRCGAVLAGNRTFYGSFCESCRTRWDEPSEQLDL